MKRLLPLIAMAPTAALAQAFGTKKDLAASAPTGSGPAVQGMDILQMLLALAVVGILLKWGLPKIVGKFNGWKSSQSKAGIAVMESIAIGAGTVQIVEVRGRTLLLGATPTQINFLADLTVPAPVEIAEEEVPAFFDILDEQMENPSVQDQPHPAFAIIETEVEDDEADNMSLDEAARLLEQAKKRRAVRNSDDDDNPFDRINRLIG